MPPGWQRARMASDGAMGASGVPRGVVVQGRVAWGTLSSQSTRALLCSGSHAGM